MHTNLKIALVVAGIIAIAAVLFFFAIPRRERLISGTASSPLATVALTASAEPTLEPSPTSSTLTNPLTGVECSNALRRPIAVMMAGDGIARPLSGIGEADVVIEMPVITGSITRFMAIFICRDPIEIGSVRSARHNFIPLAQSFDAIYAHWGGSHFALDALKSGAIANIDALINPTGAYWRKERISAPHNGFTSMTRLLKAAKFLGYRSEGQTPVYDHISDEENIEPVSGSLEIGYPGEFRLRYVYDPQRRMYSRIRGGVTETDRNSGEAVQVRNIVIMRAASKQIEGQYNDVEVEGGGDAIVYRGGREISAKWSKDQKAPEAKLRFADAEGKEVPFLKGNVWIEIVEPYTDVRWTASVSSPTNSSTKTGL